MFSHPFPQYANAAHVNGLLTAETAGGVHSDMAPPVVRGCPASKTAVFLSRHGTRTYFIPVSMSTFDCKLCCEVMASLNSLSVPQRKGRRCAFQSNASHRAKVNCRAQVQGLAQEDAVGATDVQALNALLSRVEASHLEPEPGMALSTESDGAIDGLFDDTGALIQTGDTPGVSLLPELEQPAVCHEHRMAPESATYLDAVLSTSKYRERYMEFMNQLKGWGYAGAVSHVHFCHWCCTLISDCIANAHTCVESVPCTFISSRAAQLRVR